jgi:hypothetical protein
VNACAAQHGAGVDALIGLSDCVETCDCDGGSGGSGTGGTGGSPPPAPASCAETGTYCEGNVLYDCATKSVVVSCNSCQWVGPGTGSEYDTTCKAKQSDCQSCNSEDPWTGAGCYFGGGPRVCG